MTKLSPFVPLLAPPVWTWTSGLFLTPLATALGSAHPDLVSSAWQCVIFTTSAILSGWVMGKAAQGETVTAELTTSDMRRALQEAREQERALAEETRQYQYVARGAQKVQVGKRAYHFPPGINLEHLLALGHVVSSGNPPTDRALVPPFTRGDGETYQTFRDWVIYHAGGKPGELAQFRTKRGDWDFTPLGTVMLYEWLKSYYSPTQTPPEVKKMLISLSKAMRERTSNHVRQRQTP